MPNLRRGRVRNAPVMAPRGRARRRGGRRVNENNQENVAEEPPRVRKRMEAMQEPVRTR